MDDVTDHLQCIVHDFSDKENKICEINVYMYTTINCTNEPCQEMTEMVRSMKMLKREVDCKRGFQVFDNPTNISFKAWGFFSCCMTVAVKT